VEETAYKAWPVIIDGHTSAWGIKPSSGRRIIPFGQSLERWTVSFVLYQSTASILLVKTVGFKGQIIKSVAITATNWNQTFIWVQKDPSCRLFCCEQVTLSDSTFENPASSQGQLISPKIHSIDCSFCLAKAFLCTQVPFVLVTFSIWLHVSVCIAIQLADPQLTAPASSSYNKFHNKSYTKFYFNRIAATAITLIASKTGIESLFFKSYKFYKSYRLLKSYDNNNKFYINRIIAMAIVFISIEDDNQVFGFLPISSFSAHLLCSFEYFQEFAIFKVTNFCWSLIGPTQIFWVSVSLRHHSIQFSTQLSTQETGKWAIVLWEYVMATIAP
jgi:hypothetical protein